MVQYTSGAPLASPAFTGVPTAPTAAALDNSTQIATDAYADAAVLVEKTRALAAEGLLAPKASPAFTGNAQINGDLSIKPPASAGTAIVTGGTINPAGLTVYKAAPTGAVTGIIISPGDQNGQILYVINNSLFYLTFAAVGTSNVANGLTERIGWGEGRLYIWDSTTAVWFGCAVNGVASQTGGTIDFPGSVEFDGGINLYSAITYQNTAGGINSAGSCKVITPTFANGTAAQLSDVTLDYMVYLTVGTAGTGMVIAIGPTNTPANTIVPSSVATAGQMYSIRLPAGWYLKWSDTTGTLAGQKAISC